MTQDKQYQTLGYVVLEGKAKNGYTAVHGLFRIYKRALVYARLLELGGASTRIRRVSRRVQV